MSSVNTVYDVWGRKIHGDVEDTKVKAPNMFERAKEEYDAVVGSIHQRRSSMDGSEKLEFKSEKTDSMTLYARYTLTEDGKKKPTMIKKAKSEIKSLFQQKDKTRHHHHHHHHHSVRSDEVKAPNVFERAHEEIETVIDTIHSKKEEGAGFGCSVGKLLEKICSPWGDSKKD